MAKDRTKGEIKAEIASMKATLEKRIAGRIKELNEYYKKKYPYCDAMQFSDQWVYLRTKRREMRQRNYVSHLDEENVKLDAKIKRMEKEYKEMG